jgi:hypothetical protein
MWEKINSKVQKLRDKYFEIISIGGTGLSLWPSRRNQK